jgi:carbonic anhydrase/acetyltransferase-like protein (isoleucine patch superfamily)
VSFQTQSGEKDVYLVVAGAPSSLHKYAAFTEGYTKQYRYPYELGIAGAVPDGYQAGYSRGTAPAGGHWHANGGGWVDDNAKVAATAYVGPNAAVFGSSTVSANARIEGMSWVNDGATVSGNAVVKDNALISGGANLSGNIVVGGDAELWITCSSGTYLMYDTNRGCDGKGGESDVNAPYSRFTDAQLAVSATTPSPTTPSPTTASPTTASPTTASPSAVPSPATTTSAPSPTPTLTSAPTSSSPPATPSPTTTPTKKKCTAVYGPVQQTSTGYTEDITVTAGAGDINSWIVTWKLPKGATATSWQGANLTSSGRKITAVNLSGSGNLSAGSSTGFTLTVSSSAAASTPKLTCRAA